MKMKAQIKMSLQRERAATYRIRHIDDGNVVIERDADRLDGVKDKVPSLGKVDNGHVVAEVGNLSVKALSACRKKRKKEKKEKVID